MQTGSTFSDLEQRGLYLSTWVKILQFDEAYRRPLNVILYIFCEFRFSMSGHRQETHIGSMYTGKQMGIVEEEKFRSMIVIFPYTVTLFSSSSSWF